MNINGDSGVHKDVHPTCSTNSRSTETLWRTCLGHQGQSSCEVWFSGHKDNDGGPERPPMFVGRQGFFFAMGILDYSAAQARKPGPFQVQIPSPLLSTCPLCSAPGGTSLQATTSLTWSLGLLQPVLLQPDMPFSCPTCRDFLTLRMKQPPGQSLQKA